LLIKTHIFTQTVTKMKNLKYISFIVLITLFISCSDQNVHEKHKVEIITLLINKFSAISEFPQKIPPRPLPLYKSSKLKIAPNKKVDYETAYGTLQDSIKAFNHHKKLVAKKQIIAIDSILDTPNYEVKILNYSCKSFFKLYQEFIKNDKKGIIKLKKIKLKRVQDSIVSFNKEKFNIDKSQFHLDIDKGLSFSNIVFNSDFTRAIVEMHLGDSRLSGFGELFFLERKNNNWIIVCSKGLYTS